jgi:hypothetical protein
MATIVTRIGKGSALTFAEGDANLTNLNNDKLEASGGTLTGYKETVHSLGTNNSPALTVGNGNVQTVTITTGLELSGFSDQAAGQTLTLLVTGTGTLTTSGAVTWKIAGGNTTLTNFSVVSIVYDGSIYWVSVATDFQ